MKRPRFFCIIAFVLMFISNSNGQTINDWENPDVNGINKEKPHAYGFLASDKEKNPQVVSLNGIWKFKWSPDPQSRPVDFFQEDYSTVNWDNILVPVNWELQGFGTPIYSNIPYPFKSDPPKVISVPDKRFTSFLERDPVGSYTTSFKVPDNWSGKTDLSQLWRSSIGYVCLG